MRQLMSAACLGLALLAGCASEVKRSPTTLTAAVPEAGLKYATTVALELVPESGYRRSVAAGTELAVAGRVPQGLVLKPTQTVLTLEGAHMHEAYLVLQDGHVVGFFLPVERAFSALPKPVPITLQERK